MNPKQLKSGFYLLTVLAFLALIVGSWGWAPAALGANPQEASAPSARSAASEDSLEVALQSASAGDPLILSYAAKFICQEPLQPGTWFYGVVAPLVRLSTDVLVHNPHDFSVSFYKKAVIAPLEDNPPVQPGAWHAYQLAPDHAFRIDCDDIARLLTGNPSATFIGTYGIGVTVEGFVVIGIGPQAIPGATPLRYAPLDVTAEYERSSEVLKKDVNYQPWWWWWWWPLPWRLGYAYERVLPINDLTQNIDCRGALYDALHQDVDRVIVDPTMNSLTHQSLEAGRMIDPTNILQHLTNEAAPALVAMLGRCDKIDQTSMAADYVLLSNKGYTDPDPRTGLAALPSQVLYPWIPGRWYDLPVVMPQNISTDIDDYFHKWQIQRWIDAGEDPVTVNAAMLYYFPYWCGWGHWWPWWNSGDCTDIGVGEGESLDVETINPTRVFMSQWPPLP